MSINSRGVALTASVGAALAGAVFAAAGIAGPKSGPALSEVATANQKAEGYAPAVRLSPQLQQIVWAQGSNKLENPSGVDSFYGYQNDVPSADDPALPQMVPTPGNNTEAQKTEPDKNTYLVFKEGLKGGDASYGYGTHFLFQGHENARKDNNADKTPHSYITRINLDADAEHRVTRLASEDADGNAIATIDGSTWDPWARRLLFTTESTSRPTYAATPDYPSTVEDVSGALGRG